MNDRDVVRRSAVGPGKHAGWGHHASGRIRLGGILAVIVLLTAACTETPGEVRISVESTLVLDFSDAPALPDYSAAVVEMDDGFVVAPRARPASLLEFDRDGRFVAAHLQRGEGPGELDTVRDLEWDGDVLILEQDSGVHRYDRDFAHLSSGPPAEGSTRATLDVSDGDWVAEFNEYDIRLEGGDVHIDTEPEWWAPADAPPELAGYMDLTPAVLDLGEVDGLLWVVVGVPVPDPELVQRMEAGERVEVTEVAEHVLRVHDAATGEFVAEQRFDWLPLQFLESGRAWAAVPEGDAVAIRIYRPEVR